MPSMLFGMLSWLSEHLLYQSTFFFFSLYKSFVMSKFAQVEVMYADEMEDAVLIGNEVTSDCGIETDQMSNRRFEEELPLELGEEGDENFVYNVDFDIDLHAAVSEEEGDADSLGGHGQSDDDNALDNDSLVDGDELGAGEAADGNASAVQTVLHSSGDGDDDCGESNKIKRSTTLGEAPRKRLFEVRLQNILRQWLRLLSCTVSSPQGEVVRPIGAQRRLQRATGARKEKETQKCAQRARCTRVCRHKRS